MFKPRHAKIIAAALACGMVFLSSVPSSAQTKFLEHIRRKYQMDKTNGKCELCHLLKPKEEPGRKNLNDLGKRIQDHPTMKPLLGKDDKYVWKKEELAVVEKIVAELEQEDMDKDGVSNVEEFELGSMPTDAKSMPDKLALKKWRTANPDRAFKGAASAPAKK